MAQLLYQLQVHHSHSHGLPARGLAPPWSITGVKNRSIEIIYQLLLAYVHISEVTIPILYQDVISELHFAINVYKKPFHCPPQFWPAAAPIEL